MTDYIRVVCIHCGENVDVAVRISSVEVDRSGRDPQLVVTARGAAPHSCPGITQRVSGD